MECLDCTLIFTHPEKKWMAYKSIRLTDMDGNLMYPESGQSDSNSLKLADGTLIKWGNAKVVAGSYAPIAENAPKFVGSHDTVATVRYAQYSNLAMLCVSQPQTSGQDNVYVRYGTGNVLSSADIEKAYVEYVQIGRWK